MQDPYFLQGKKALVLGIANDNSIAWGCAKAFRDRGAELAITYLNAKALPHVEPLAQAVGAQIFMPCDVRNPGELEAVFEQVRERWGRLDVLLHSIAFGPREDIGGRLVDSSDAGFQLAMSVSVHSFIRMARLAEPLMAAHGGTLFTMSYFGAHQVVKGYHFMSPVKAALEASTRVLAAELGPNIRVHAISPGPIQTRAASALDHFDELLNEAAEKAPARRLATIDDVGQAAAALASDAAQLLTGQTLYVDGGYHIID